MDLPEGPLDHAGMQRIPSGRWQVGEEGPTAIPGDSEGPRREVTLGAFLIDEAAVTNADFADFVAETGYVTQAETLRWSFVFMAQMHPAAAIAQEADAMAPEWWVAVRDACWRRPDGPGTDWRQRPDHPVVHVSAPDAEAFARHRGKRLPGELEWEVAARGGLDGKLYGWGNALTPEGRHMCNIWQGRFPVENRGEDGWLSTAPARSFPPNGYGLFNMLGNVWEWTRSPWVEGAEDARVIRGGSYLCHASYCHRYRVSARTWNHPLATSSHLGFRCVADMPGQAPCP
ncbi:formylglycine-generating enzyme family protein [Pseudooceanicola algae]|nr:formylglycine-generating enzyme family protein [Pseudooceanicola algae]